MRESSINMVNTILVSNSAELIKAMKSATGGENIVLKGGNYGDLNLWQGHTLNAIYTSPIKITSASHDNQAVFTGLRLNGVTNVTFSDVKFDYVSAVGEPTTTSKFNLLNTKNISILNSVCINAISLSEKCPKRSASFFVAANFFVWSSQY